MSKAKLFQKMVKVMQSVGSINKGSEVRDKNGKLMYNYMSEEAVTKKVQDACIEIGLVMYPIKTDSEVISLEGVAYGKPFKNAVTKVVVTYCIGDADTGETIEIQSIGYGADAQDKGSNKALTGAFKYAQRQSFLISSGEDPDHTPNDLLDQAHKDSQQQAEQMSEVERKRQQREEYEKKKAENSLANPSQKQTMRAYAGKIAALKGMTEEGVIGELKNNAKIGAFEWDTLLEDKAKVSINLLNKWLGQARNQQQQQQA